MGSLFKKTLVILAILLVAMVVVAMLGGDGGTLDFAYEGFD